MDEWLSGLKSEQFNKRVAPALFDLLALKTGDKLEVKHGKLLIKQFDDDFVIDEVSDGFKSIIALASDIMQALSADKSSYHSTQGIVLIDELGNHLHPRWRMQIVDSLRRAFPNLQFIVTTHEPLCLRGLAHGEVNVLVRDQQQEIRVLDSKVLPYHNALRVDQLLTSDLFGLLDTIDPKIEKTYKEYYALLSKNDRTIAEEDKVNELKIQLVSLPRYMSQF
ncbi:AAA family ATPase [Spirosoma endophyticum]|uniref:AAA domain-containing protein, putative AbiEii toxin, Type IV TA system n=1 Tax=Spirosoma endophyticum TaxID=662367 RepID=A0A1I2IKM0_9BACT|nr:AAA family ATPase [Spirosoma endophyticum]SFF41587.1 AAA domain-containing protein, putative AbiEii toxin, Type IV TA system [Spirosoma endophyticum]